MRQVCETLDVSIDMPATCHADSTQQVAFTNCFSTDDGGDVTKRRSNTLNQGPPAKFVIVEPEMMKKIELKVDVGTLEEGRLENGVQAPL